MPLLSNDLLNVSSEEQVLSAVARWLKHEGDCFGTMVTAGSVATGGGGVTRLSSIGIGSDSAGAYSKKEQNGSCLLQRSISCAGTDSATPSPDPVASRQSQPGAHATAAAATDGRARRASRSNSTSPSTPTLSGDVSQIYAPTLSYGAQSSAVEQFTEANDQEPSSAAVASSGSPPRRKSTRYNADDETESNLVPNLPLSTSHENVPFTESMDDADNEDRLPSTRYTPRSSPSSNPPSRPSSSLSQVRPPSTSLCPTSTMSRPRCEHAHSLLKCVRLPQLKIQSLLDIDAMPVFRASLECRDILDHAKRYHLQPEGEKRRELRRSMENYRSRKSTRGFVFAVGGKKSSEKVACSVEIYDSR